GGGGGEDGLPQRAVQDEEIAGAVVGDADGQIEAGGGGCPVDGAVLARHARQRGDGAGPNHDFPDRIVLVIGDEDVAGAVAGDVERPGEAGGGARRVDAAAHACRARQRGDGSGGDDDLSDG